MKISTSRYGELLAGLMLLAALDVSAHKLSPTGTTEERKITEVRGGWLSGLERRATGWGLHTFGDPVHEEITNRIYGCDGTICGGLDSTRAPGAVLAGVRWNDDPPFKIGSTEGRRTTCKVTQTIRFQTQPTCWYMLFKDAEKRATKGASFTAAEHSAMLYRTHFGDLQFLHAMASEDGEPASVTQRAMLEWAEFNWRLMMGEYGIETMLASVDVPTIKKVFGKSAWYVQDLYTQGSPRLRAQIKDVAFGTILHTLQDSFAEGHVERASALRSRRCDFGGRQLPAPGEIVEFHSYVHQDHSLHAASDSRGAFQEHLQDEPDVVEIGRALLTAYEAGTAWPDVQPYFSCIYALNANARSSSPGEQYRLAGE